MKPLPTDFTEKGYRYRQLSRDGNVAVYSQQWGENGSEAFETVLVQSHNGREAFGKVYPPTEYYPSSGQWGTAGFTFNTRDQALAKAAVLAHNPKSAIQ